MIRLNGRQADENALKRLIETGVISNDDLNSMTMSGGFVATEPQAQAQPPARKIKVLGVSPGAGITELGEEEWAAPKLDYTRPKIQIAGLGTGYYSSDGRSAYIGSPDTGLTKVVLGYDRAASSRLNDRELLRRKQEAEIAQTMEATALARQQREQGRTVSPQWSNDLQAWVLPPSADNPQGRLLQPPGAEAGGKLNDTQGKAMTFGMRAANSHEILNAVGQDGKVQPGLVKRVASSLPVVGDALGLATNWTQDDDQRQVEQAQRDFVNAVLRRESGAVISPGEFTNATLQYFPQPGDDPQTIANKKRNREIAIMGLAAEAGPGRKRVLDMREQARALFEARKAIKGGADPVAVRQRLQQLGISEMP